MNYLNWDVNAELYNSHIKNSLSNYYIISLGHYCIVLVRHEDGDHQSRIVLAFLSMQSRVISAGITQKKWMCLCNVFTCVRARARFCVNVCVCVFMCVCLCACVRNELFKKIFINLSAIFIKFIEELKNRNTSFVILIYRQCHD